MRSTLRALARVSLPVLLSATLVACGDEDSAPTSDDPSAESATESADEPETGEGSGSPTETPTDPSETPSASGSGDGGDDSTVACEFPDAPSAAQVDQADPPPAEAERRGDVPVTLSTSAGDITGTLDSDATPCTVSNVVSLAEQGFWDDTPCHRLTTDGIYVLQCGDPSGTGMGGPGYTIPDELSGDETYPAGTMAMAKTAAPDSGGSQFFLVYEDSPLPPEYTVFGQLDDAGLEVLESIGERGTQGGIPDGPPTKPVTIGSVTTG